LRITDGNGGVTLTSIPPLQPHTLVATVMAIPMRLFFKGVAKKALLQDLNDIKAAVERSDA
jgi:hypothetical protein